MSLLKKSENVILYKVFLGNQLSEIYELPLELGKLVMHTFVLVCLYVTPLLNFR